MPTLKRRFVRNNADKQAFYMNNPAQRVRGYLPLRGKGGRVSLLPTANSISAGGHGFGALFYHHSRLGV